MSDNSLSNLKRGENHGNRGGGQTIQARETKQAFLDAMMAAKAPDGKPFNLALKEGLIADALNPSWRYQSARQWIAEFQHGKPNAKVEHIVDQADLLGAFVQALFDEGVLEDVAARVLERIKAVILADAG